MFQHLSILSLLDN